jgi:hypothetical protein
MLLYIWKNSTILKTKCLFALETIFETLPIIGTTEILMDSDGF